MSPIFTLDELEARLTRAGRNEGPTLLADWWSSREVTIEQLQALIIAVWSGAEWPSQSLEEEEWLELFEATGFVTDAARGRLSTPLTVWRGAALAAGHRGFSWTPDIGKARWFARRETLFGHGPAGVWEAIVPPAYVLAIIERARPGEPETIVDPTYFDEVAQEVAAERGFSAPRLLETIECEN